MTGRDKRRRAAKRREERERREAERRETVTITEVHPARNLPVLQARDKARQQ